MTDTRTSSCRWPVIAKDYTAAITERLSGLIIRWRWMLIIGWITLAIALRLVAPPFSEVAADGDFDFLPDGLSSVDGGHLINRAFPGERPRSQVVLILSRPSPLTRRDDVVSLDLQRRLYHHLAIAAWQRFNRTADATPGPVVFDDERLRKLINDSFDRSIAADSEYYELIADKLSLDVEITPRFPRMAVSYFDRANWLQQIGADAAKITEDFDAALTLFPGIETKIDPLSMRPANGFEPLLDVQSWDDTVIGGKLKTDSARLAILQLSTELAATENIATVEAVERMIQRILSRSAKYTDPGLTLRMTGSAAIGGETLMAARDAIRYTETITVLTILLILIFVYRAPLLVFIPMASIGIAVVSAISIVCLLADPEGVALLRLFTTSKIFIVVILFGAGTDYCLFLISRLREESRRASWLVANQKALAGVSGALIGSAMTTVVGLAMLGVAQFGKFSSTGPVIATCLLTGLAVCLTFTPALLSVIGSVAFWPSRRKHSSSFDATAVGVGATDEEFRSPFWSWTSLQLTRRPMVWLIIGWIGLIIPGVYGFRNETSVTYDISSELDSDANSRVGLETLRHHFNIGEINPVTLLIHRERPVDRKTTSVAIKKLSSKIYDMPHVVAVRTADDPLGDFPPSREMGLLSGDGLRRRLLREHRTAQNYFYSPTQQYAETLVRLDIALDGDPFDGSTADMVEELQTNLTGIINQPGGDFWKSQVYMVGTTASLIDLRKVITEDNRRIKIAVVIAVFLVLLAVIRKLTLSLYLIATVLLSYYATLGLTMMFFRAMYGDQYVGLDWKLPVFLFVILVAIGQDYNVYLVTRVVEEERRLGWISAIRRAVSRTGGIITACGLVMAATFFSMTASGWMPPILQWLGIEVTQSRSLRGIVELGFALGLGMIVDTLYVRTILVPSFIAAMGKRRQYVSS